MALNFLNNGYFAGKVGIGTESPNAKLEVNSAITFSTIDTFGQLVVKAASGSTGDMLNIGVDTANSATFIQANDRGVGTIPLSLQRYGGYVGIGTISPTTPLSIESSGSDEFIKIENTATYTGLWMNDSGTNNGWLVLSGYTDAVSLGDFAIREYGVQTSLTIKQTTGNVGIGTTSPSEKLTLQLDAQNQAFSGKNGTDYLWFLRNEAGAGARQSGRFQLMDTDVTTVNIESASNRNTYFNAGNVGIGTTNPGTKLDVVGTVRSYVSAGNYGQIENGSFQAVGDHGGTFMLDLDNTGTADLVNIKKSGSSKFYIENGGNVGIGTTSPGYKLQVNGTIAPEGNEVNNLGSSTNRFNQLWTKLIYDINDGRGLTNQILTSTGSGGIAWANASTVIGGPYLPLAGNTTATAMTGDIFLANQQQVRFLTSANDIGLRLQSSGTSSFIDNEVGDMYIRQEADSKNIFFQADNGSGGNTTYFSVRPSNGARTQFEKNTRHSDDIKAYFGNGNDLEIYHNGSNSYINDTGTGDLYIQASDNMYFQTYGSGKRWITLTENAGVDLFYDDVHKLSTGIVGVGTATTTGGTLIDGWITTTQANAINNTTIATTAYVNNKIALIPAGLRFEGTWDASTGNPPSASPENGQFWIVSVAGSTSLSGITDWKVGDWAIYVEAGTGTDGWQKVDNSSVLDGSGTGGTVAGWAGSGTSNTLTNAPITFSGSDVTFSGNVGVGTSPSSFYPGTHNLVVGDGGNEHAVTVYSGATSTGYLLFADGSSGSSRYAGQVRYDHNTDSMEFCVNNSSTAKLTINSSGNATFAGSINGGDINLSSTNNAIIDPLSVGNILRFTDNDPTQNNNQITGTIEWETKDSNNPGIQSFITTNSTNQGKGRLVFGTGLGGSAVEKMRIDSDGNVGIGDTTPTSKLTILGTSTAASNTPSDAIVDIHGTSTAHLLMGVANVSPYGAWINTDATGQPLVLQGVGGNVGIGTDSPVSLLHIKGADPVFTIQDTSTGTAQASSTLRLGESGSGGVLDVYWDIKQASDILNTHLEINHSVNGNALTILDNKNVGIGTTSPSSKLEVNGGTSNVIAKLTSTDAYSTLAFVDSATTGENVQIGAFGNDLVGYAGGYEKIRAINFDGSTVSSNPFNSVNLRLVGEGKTGWGVGDVLGQLSFYNTDGSGIGARNAASIMAICESGNGTTTTTFSSGLGFFVSGANVAEAEKMRLSDSGSLRLHGYDSTNKTGTPTYLLGTDASGNVVKTLTTPSPITSQAASLYDLIPNGAFTTTYAFTSTAGTYAKVMQGDDVITANGTYTVQMFVNDYAVGGTQYSETYSGIMSWGSSTNTNDNGGGTISEIVLHRSGHAANQGMTYLRTRETTSSEGSELRLEIMCNRTYTGASNVVFKFVRLI